jgi:hypothetical protein
MKYVYKQLNRVVMLYNMLKIKQMKYVYKQLKIKVVLYNML